MRNYLVASHGPLAKALIESLFFIIGEQKNVYHLCAYIDNKDPKDEIDRIVKELKNEGELFIFTDIFGGSVNNLMMKYVDENTFLFAGVNLPVLMQSILSKDEGKDLAYKLESEGKNTIIYCNEKIKENVAEDDF